MKSETTEISNQSGAAPDPAESSNYAGDPDVGWAYVQGIGVGLAVAAWVMALAPALWLHVIGVAIVAAVYGWWRA